jgi:hypothetical protein
LFCASDRICNGTDPFVLMSDPVARAPNLVPRLFGAKCRILFTKPDGGFADHKHFALNGPCYTKSANPTSQEKTTREINL